MKRRLLAFLLGWDAEIVLTVLFLMTCWLLWLADTE